MSKKRRKHKKTYDRLNAAKEALAVKSELVAETGDETAIKANSEVVTEAMTEIKKEASNEVKAETKTEVKPENVSETKVKAEDKSLLNTESEDLTIIDLDNDEAEASNNNDTDKSLEFATGEELQPKPKKKIFKWVLLGYVALWIVATIVVCIVLYGKVSGYQEHYDNAKAAVNPDIKAEESLYLFDENNIIDTAGFEYFGVNSYEDQESVNAFINEYYVDNTLSYSRSQDYKDTKPKYDIYIGETQAGTMTFKLLAGSDSYGFHESELASTEVSLSLPVTLDYYIEAYEGDEIFINGIPFNEDDSFVSLIDENALEKTVEKEASERTGNNFTHKIYHITGFLTKPDITFNRFGEEFVASVTSDRDIPFVNGELEEENCDNYYNLCKYYPETFSSLLDEKLYHGFEAGAQAYVYNLNKIGSYEEIARFLEPGGPAIQAVADIQRWMRWNGTPQNFNIDQYELISIVYYDENTVVVTTHDQFTYNYLGDDYDESMVIEWLYLQDNEGKWHVWDFSYI